MASRFRVDILRPDGTRIAPLTTVVSVRQQETLDSIGSLSFSFPASDPNAHHATPGRIFAVYDVDDGFLGLYVYKSANTTVTEGIGFKTIDCHSVLIELQRETVGFRRDYTFEPVEQVVYDLITIKSGWHATIDENIGYTSVTYEGESILSAVDELRERWGKHYRMVDERTLEFGAFGDHSGVRLSHLGGQIQPYYSSSPNIAIVETISEAISADDISNVIIPLSAGQQESQLTIQGATLGLYPINSTLNKDGTSYYYIMDEASVAEYGRRVRVVSFSSIRPLSNNDTDILRARNAVKLAAEAYLEKHVDPVTEYRVKIRGLQKKVLVGDKVRLTYRGATPEGVYLDVDGDFYVMSISKNMNSSGDSYADLALCSVDVRKKSDMDMIMDVVKDLRSLKLHVQPYPFWSENTYYDTLRKHTSQPWGQGDDKQAEFKVEVDNSVLRVTKVRIRFKTKPLYTLTNSQVIFGSSEHYYSYDVEIGPWYPSDIELWIGGVNKTSEYGGPWNANQSNFPVDVSLDITEDIVNAAGGLRQDHDVWLRCGDRRGNVAVNSSYPELIGSSSMGFVEMNIRILGITQSILPED